MTVSADVHKRVLHAKYFLSRARQAQTDRNELGIAVSLLLMHDASEMLMLAVSDHLQLSAKWSFMEFWAKVKDKTGRQPPHRSPMQELNSLRVGLKHKGTLSHAQTVRDLTARVEIFCEEITREFLDVNFTDLKPGFFSSRCRSAGYAPASRTVINYK
jgi:hypothetical protein